MPFIYETFSQRKISAEANAMTEYVLGLRGIVPNYGSQFLLQSVGTVLKVGTGMLVFTGRKGINTELLEIDVVPEALGTKTKYIIVTLDGTQQPTTASASITVSDTSQGSITSKTEDLMANVQGVVKFDLGTFTNTTSGINSASLTITCPIIEQEIIDNIKDDIFGIQGDLSDLRDDFDNLEIGTRNLIRNSGNIIGASLSTDGTWANGKFYFALNGGTIENVTVADSPIPSVNNGVKIKKLTTAIPAILQYGIKLIKGQYTGSVYVKGTAGAQIEMSPIRGAVSSPTKITETLNGSWQKIEMTVTNTQDTTGDLFYFRLMDPINAEVTIIAPQTERGNTASDWKPAYEDNFGLEIGARNILRGTANPILTTSTAEGTWAKGKFFYYAPHGVVENISIAESPVPSVNSAVRLYRNVNNVTTIAITQLDVYLKKGEYTVNFWYKGTVGAVISVVSVQPAGVALAQTEKIFTVQSESWNRFVYTFNSPNDAVAEICRIELRSKLLGEEITILAPQVERSSVASNWRPAPDDIPYTRSQLISSSTYAVGATIPFDLRQWDTIEVTVLVNATVRLVQSRDTEVFRGDCIFFDGNKDQVTVAVEIQWDSASSSWKLFNCSRLNHYSAPANSWHSAKIQETIKNIYGISYR